MAKKNKGTDVKIRILNIRLKSNDKVKAITYLSLVKRLFSEKASTKVSTGVAVIFRTQFEATVGKEKVLYGKIARFTPLEGQDWLDLESMETKQHELPANLFPNHRETDYYFIPAAHRLCLVEKASTVSMIAAQKFLQKALERITKQEEQVEVTIEQDLNTFEDIISALQVKRLEIDISYSNNDVGDDATEFMDDQLREAGVGNMSIVVTPDSKGDISLNNLVIGGALGVAKSNGKAAATVIDSDGQQKRVSTTHYPLKTNVHLDDDGQAPQAMFTKIMSMFRANNSNESTSES